MVEYGSGVPKGADTTVMFTNKGFQQVGNGFRIDLESYNDLVMWTTYASI